MRLETQMWSSRIEQLADGRVLKVVIAREGMPITYGEVLTCWQNDAAFRSFFITLLADVPFTAFRWETPPISDSTVYRPFEFVLLDSPGLARRPDPDAFATHFRGATKHQNVVSVSNLGKDATLVVPCPVGPSSAYGHLAAFVRE